MSISTGMAFIFLIVQVVLSFHTGVTQHTKDGIIRVVGYTVVISISWLASSFCIGFVLAFNSHPIPLYDVWRASLLALPFAMQESWTYRGSETVVLSIIALPIFLFALGLLAFSAGTLRRKP
jgi:hypothetical protein